jgi:hypothetical protein
MDDGDVTTQRDFIKDAKIVKPSHMLPLNLDNKQINS